VLNNGAASEWFNLERSVRQGCPLAPFLFVLVVELLAIAIRHDKDIKGIAYNKTYVKISQLADDTTCFLQNEESARQLLNLLDDFSKLSGLRCNLEKTEAIWIGANKGRPHGKLPVKWTTDKFCTLGITFIEDETAMANVNLAAKLANLKKCLNLWKMRDLTIIGRILVLKSLALSQLTYVITNVFTPEPFIRQIQDIINAFIWKESKPKVKLDVMALPIQDGGLKAPVFECQAKALKLSYVKRIFSKDCKPWRDCFQSCIKQIKLEDIFRSRCVLNENLMSQMPKFYKQLILAWAQIQAKYIPNSAIDVASEFIWFNPYILIDHNPVFNKKWYDKGIKRIKDILGNNNELLKDEDLKNKYGIEFSFLEYFGLRQAIPYQWKQILRENNNVETLNTNHSAVEIYTNSSTKKMYWELLNHPQEIIQQIKWLELFQLENSKWQTICVLPFKCTYETRLQSFQFSILYKFVPYKKKLHLMGLVESYNCDYCTEIDSIMHRFVECPVVKAFWGNFVRWWQRATRITITLTAETILLGHHTVNWYSLNNSILVAKYYIHVQKCSNKPINFEV
jgi:hypothetical protein